MLNNKKYLYTTYVLVCPNCTLIFSRTRKQNWIIICQCCLRIWRAGGGGWGWGGGGRGFKCFVWEGQKFFYLFCVCVCVCVVGGGQVQYLSFREKITDPHPINKWLVPITKSPKGRLFLLDIYDFMKKRQMGVFLWLNYSLKAKLIKIQFSIALIDTYSFVRD